jgi:DNA transformation protein
MAPKQKDESFVAFVVEQLAGLGGVRAKRMFGGHGLYARETFFAVVDEGRLYFRVSDATRPKYEARGMGPFAPAPTMGVMRSYYEVPLDVLEDAAELARWAREACAAAPVKKESAAKKAGAARSAARPGRKAAAKNAPPRPRRAGR